MWPCTAPFKGLCTAFQAASFLNRLCSILQRENRTAGTKKIQFLQLFKSPEPAGCTAGTKKHCFCTGCIALLRLYFLCISAIGAILKKEPVSYRIQ